MKKILIRSGMVPFKQVSIEEMLSKNILGSNVGNLVYAYSIYKTLMIEAETEFVPTYYKYNYTKEEIDVINHEFKCFIIPLADAVRKDFVKEMRGLTRLVKKLTIPCYIIGMGVRAPYDFDKERNLSYSFDQDVKEFLKAILEKSSIIGVRGEITASYLKYLGFREEVDFTVIGCPSMYMFGSDGIKVRNVKITSDSTVAFNENTLTLDEPSAFIRRNVKKFKEYYFIPQHIREARIMYAGVPYNESLPEGFPKRITDDIYREGRCRFFGDVPTWISFLKQIDFCFGSRLHGNIMSTLAGTPSILIPFDARARELAEYHQLTHVPYKQIDSKTDIFDLIERVDFHSPEKCQKKNFEHYIDFLDKNDIEHIYRRKYNEQNPFEQKMRKVQLSPALISITQSDASEVARRLDWFSEMQQKKMDDLRKIKGELQKEKDSLEKEFLKAEEKLKQLEIEKEEQKKIIKDQERKLNYKSIKVTMKIRDGVAKTGIVKAMKNFKGI